MPMVYNETIGVCFCEYVWRKISMNEDLKRKIINFSVSNDLEISNAILNKFNPFKVLRIQDTEIRHSNVIVWILNPNENHNLSDRI